MIINTFIYSKILQCSRTFLLSLGATGPQGVQGATGATGSQGTKGDVGAPGIRGNPGERGTINIILLYTYNYDKLLWLIIMVKPQFV